jgi:transmembrane sensor
MMAATGSLIEEQAIAWTIRARDPDFDDWDALTEWLEADAAHGATFQRMSLLDDILPDLMPAPAKQQWRQILFQPSRWSASGFGAIAAVFIAVITLSVFMVQPSYYSVETGSGEQRVIALDDGSRIELNGDTQVTLSKDDPRFAVLDRGEALFTVVHNNRDPFIVEVGDAVVQDAGTVFNIVHSGESTEVGVAEGLVIYNPDADKVTLAPGRGLRVAGRGRVPEMFSIPTAAVGSWKRGQLTYNDADMGRIADDLSRSLGAKISVDAQAKSMRFTGTINLTKDVGQFFGETAAVLGVNAKRTKDGWILAGADEASR